MNLLDLANELNLNPKRLASKEYHSACPGCNAGRDRFIIWPETNRYWCRQCGKKGDAIQFCRDFLGMAFRDACAKLGSDRSHPLNRRIAGRHEFAPKASNLPPDPWRENASIFISRCHQDLLKNLTAIQLLHERGLTLETMRTFALGWHSADEFLLLPDWGLPNACNETGKEKKLWLPKGLVLPTCVDNKPIKLKIRRSNWVEGDVLPKYVEITGSMKCPSIYGDPAAKAVVIVEAEFDAMLIDQFCHDLCCCMAIGGAGKKPDLDSDRFLRNVKHLFFALDFDQAGKKAYKFWKSTYPHIKAWPIPKGKSPGDAYKLGVNLRNWILGALKTHAV